MDGVIGRKMNRFS